MNPVLENIQSLHSTRQFLKKPIGQENLDTIIDAALCAGNSGNRQVYSIVAVDDPKLLQKYFYGADRALVFLVDFNRWLDLAQQFGLNIEDSIDGLRGLTISSMDAMLAAQNAALAAKSLGIASLFTTSLHRTDLLEIYTELNLPEKYCFPYLSLCLGFSAETDQVNKGRVKKGVVHYGKYHKLSDQELADQIALYDDDSNHLGFTSRNQWQKEGYHHYLERYFTKFSKPQPIEEIQAFYDAMARNGFLDFEKFCPTS